MFCEATALSKNYGDFSLRLDFGIAEGEFVSLVGPSGCGKTTALRILAGLEEADSGSFVIGGVNVTSLPSEDRGIGLIFQDSALFPYLSVERNVGYGLEVRGVPKAERTERVRTLLERMRLSGFGKRSPAELSGGERQRVALARALAVSPRLLLFDEPLSAVDTELKRVLRTEILRARELVGFTALYVTHDQAEALSISDRIIVLENGRIAQTGTPEAVYREPENRFVAEFFGGGNFIRGQADNTAEGIVAVRTGAGTLRGRMKAGKPGHDRPVELFFRAEDVQVVPAGEGRAPEVRSGASPENLLHGRIVSVEYEGFRYRIEAEAGDGLRLTAYARPGEKPEAGTAVTLAIPAVRSLILPC